jgi:AraC-like DNA-binding protein
LTSLFENNLRAAMTVRDIAKALNMSESSLAHICTELLGVSPAKALNRYRIEKAAQWLSSSDMTVKEIAIQLGFHDASHFIHAFRHQRGKSPGAFRSAVSRHDGAAKAASIVFHTATASAG